MSIETRVQPDGPEFWVEPWGGPVTGNTPPASDADLAEAYSLQLNIALEAVNRWKNEYSQAKFLWTYDEQAKYDAPFRYDWLQVNTAIPNKGPNNQSDFSSEDFNSVLLESSNLFQRLAVGWEQVEFEKTDKYFRDNFTNTKNEMIVTLCTLELILADKRLNPVPDPTRAIMPAELRSITANSQRDERNFRILKEYVVTLEYYAECFAYFQTKFSEASL